MPWSFKAFIMIAIVSLTFGYSVYKDREIKARSDIGQGLILPKLPSFKVQKVEDLSELTSDGILNSLDRGLLVHFWGTWCAPCEAELPSFVEFARKFEGSGVKFLILAVNDEVLKVRKFIKRFNKNLPKNIIFAIDEKGKTLDLFGTVKVPETYLFNKASKNLEKFVGPQEWNLAFFEAKVERRLLDISAPPVFKKVETH